MMHRQNMRGVPHLVLNPSAHQAPRCPIASVGVPGITPGDAAKSLLSRYSLWTVAMDNENVQGVRITPQLLTTTRELDTFVVAPREPAHA